MNTGFEQTIERLAIEAGRQNITTMFKNLRAPWDFFVQMTHSGVIDVAADRQTATVTGGRRRDIHVNCQAGHRRDPYRAFPKEDGNLGKILEIHTELPGRIHVVLIRQPVGY